jgi:uncharacterized membrane protein
MVKMGPWISEGWELVKKDLLMHAVMMLVVSILSSTWVLGGPAACGYFYVLLKKMRRPDEPISFGDLFKGFEVFLPALIASLVIGAVMSVAGSIVIPALILQGLLIFVWPLIMDKRMDFWPAIMESYERTKGEWLSFALFALVAGIIGGLGGIACCIGIFFSMPVMFGAMAVAYRDVIGLAPEQA